MEIKPIETHYNGYRFRSRLEARWAVFFDAAGIKYEYEPEGFELKSGRKYLPDFWLLEFQIYVEIKPSLDPTDPSRREQYDAQEELCGEFRNDTGKAILLYRGNPWDDIWGLLFAFFEDKKGLRDVSDYDARFADVSLHSRNSTLPILMVGDISLYSIVCVNNAFADNKKVVNARKIMEYYPEYTAVATLSAMTEPTNFYFPDIWNKAKKKAKQARFKYGEMPSIKGE